MLMHCSAPLALLAHSSAHARADACSSWRLPFPSRRFAVPRASLLCLRGGQDDDMEAQAAARAQAARDKALAQGRADGRKFAPSTPSFPRTVEGRPPGSAGANSKTRERRGRKDGKPVQARRRGGGRPGSAGPNAKTGERRSRKGGESGSKLTSRTGGGTALRGLGEVRSDRWRDSPDETRHGLSPCRTGATRQVEDASGVVGEAGESKKIGRSAGQSRDFRDIDRDRQRRAKESREAAERRRRGAGVAYATELLEYVEVRIRVSGMLAQTRK